MATKTPSTELISLQFFIISQTITRSHMPRYHGIFLKNNNWLTMAYSIWFLLSYQLNISLNNPIIALGTNNSMIFNR